MCSVLEFNSFLIYMPKKCMKKRFLHLRAEEAPLLFVFWKVNISFGEFGDWRKDVESVAEFITPGFAKNSFAELQNESSFPAPNIPFKTIARISFQFTHLVDSIVSRGISLVWMLNVWMSERYRCSVVSWKLLHVQKMLFSFIMSVNYHCFKWYLTWMDFLMLICFSHWRCAFVCLSTHVNKDVYVKKNSRGFFLVLFVVTKMCVNNVFEIIADWLITRFYFSFVHSRVLQRG